MPALVQLAAVYTSGKGARSSRMLVTNSCARCGCDPPCPLRAACRLRSALREAQRAFYAELDRITVADLVASPTGPALVGLGGARRPA